LKIPLRDAGAISIGIELVVSVVLGLVAGGWLDRRFGIAPWMTLVGIALGSAAGFRSLLRYTRRAAARQEREDRAESALEEKQRTSDADRSANPDEPPR
jgi:ATP synthase protein I